MKSWKPGWVYLPIGLLLTGCSIRMSAMLETEEAVYSKHSSSSEQSYNTIYHPTFIEAVAGVAPQIITPGTKPILPPPIVTPIPHTNSSLITVP